MFLRLNRHRARQLFLTLLFVAAVLRLVGINWDEGHHLHPDERFISMVEEKISFPDSAAEYFDSARSSLNPYNRGHDSFVYGTLPIFLTKAVSGILGKTGYGGSFLVGRALSALADLASIWFAYLLTRRFSRGRRTALAAAAFLAFCPLGIQLSHFWAVDTFLTALSTLTLLGAVRLAQRRSGPAEVAAIGVALGLAVACKVTALALFLPVGLGILIGAFENVPRDLRQAGLAAARMAGRFALCLAAAAVAARVALPYAFAGPGFFSFRLDSRYVGDMKRLAQLSSSVAGFPPAFQWAGRTILFPIQNVVLWGAGPFFGLAALAALVWAIFAARKAPRRALLPLVAHAVFLLLYHGLSIVKSIRYFYPAYPALAVLAALFLADVAARAASARLPAVRLLRFLPAVALIGAFLGGVAFSSIYRRPHPRVAASRWIFENVPPPARFANESWDDALPLSLPGYDMGAYNGPQLALFDPDSPQKANDVVQILKGADWVAVTSNRVYANLTRLPVVFPLSRAYYSALFQERLGFDLVADFNSYPSLGPLKFPDDRAEEQFTVYDHPRVVLFRKSPSFSPDRAKQILLASMPQTPPTLNDWEKWPRSRQVVGSPIYPPRRADLQKTSGAPSTRELEIGSVGGALVWYLSILLVGAVAFPLAHAFFPRLADRGAGVSKTLGVVGTTFLLALVVQLRILPNGRGAAWTCLAAAALISASVFFARRRLILAFIRERNNLLIGGEIAFALGFLLFLAIRALNPEIYWGEKPMDFSILNILVRTRSLPTSDPWFAGAPLGYYAFGHQMVAFLTLLTGLSTRFTFNLAFGLLGGLLVQGAFTLLRNWAGTVRAGVAGAALVAILGNLSGLREWLVNHRALDWNYFWATSRVIKDTINEYPFWSLVFADLHAHVLAMPLFLLFGSAALHFVRVNADPPARAVSRVASGVILGFAAATQALTNAWDAPLLAGLCGIVFVVAASARPISAGNLARVGLGVAAAVATGWVVAAPLWVRGGGRPGVGWEQEPGARGVDVLTVFGLFFFLAFAWWLAAAGQRLTEHGMTRGKRYLLLGALGGLLVLLGFLSVEVFAAAGCLLFLAAAVDVRADPDERIACGFIAAAFFLVLFTQKVYISDRMNTIFKLYLEAWLLLAVATAALAFRRKDRRGVFSRWDLAPRAVLALLVLAALFTTVTAARGAVRNHFAAYSGPSLDGLRYLEESKPGEYRAVLWLRRSLRGTPVILEAQGAPYQDFSRISMLTGLPTVLGWEHHVKQRGNPETDVVERRQAIERIYSSREAAPIERLLRRFHVGYVYVGWLERKTYPVDGLRKFDRATDLFERVYENPEVKIYRVIGGDSEDVIAPARETVPVIAGAEVVEEEEAPSIAETSEEGKPPFWGMKEPRDGDVDARGRIWVADFGNSRLRIFEGDGGFLGGWGGRGNGTFGLREPCALAIHGDDLYIADTWNGRIQLFTLSGEAKGSAPSLYGPRGVASAADGKVWVTDTGNHQLVTFDALLQNRQVVGKKGSGAGEFSSPVGIAIGPSGSVYVADVGNHRVEVLDRDGRFVRAFNVPGWEGPVEPHLEIGDDETVYASDPAIGQVHAFGPSGSLQQTWTSDASGATFARPTGLALDRKRGILYVIDSGKNSVLRLDLPKRKTS